MHFHFLISTWVLCIFVSPATTWAAVGPVSFERIDSQTQQCDEFAFASSVNHGPEDWDTDDQQGADEDHAFCSMYAYSTVPPTFGEIESVSSVYSSLSYNETGATAGWSSGAELIHNAYYNATQIGSTTYTEHDLTANATVKTVATSGQNPSSGNDYITGSFRLLFTSNSNPNLLAQNIAGEPTRIRVRFGGSQLTATFDGDHWTIVGQLEKKTPQNPTAQNQTINDETDATHMDEIYSFSTMAPLGEDEFVVECFSRAALTYTSNDLDEVAFGGFVLDVTVDDR
jgi:hypothetical protein